MSDEFDPLNFESGLVDKATGPVVKAWFAPDPNMGPNYMLHLEIAPTEKLGPNVEELIEKYGCGPDWRSFDGGQTLEHPKGEMKTFNQNSQVAKVVQQFLKIGAPLKDRRDPRKAEFFIGVNCAWERIEIGRNFNDSTKAVTRLMPVKFLSMAGAGEVVSTAEVVTNGHSDVADLDALMAGLPMKDQLKVQELARTLPHSDWVDAVMDEVGSTLSKPDIVRDFGNEDGLYARLKA